MDKLIIHGGSRLVGTVEISGAKNSALPLLSATILSSGVHTITNVPKLKDIETFLILLEHLGTKVDIENDGTTVKLDSSSADKQDAPYELVKTMRASILVLGPLLARYGKASVSMPGGCAIGERPVDLHLTALEKMGAKVEIEHGYIKVECKKLKGAHIYFDTPTVTGTENIMMAATLADGETVIENAALEPEVAELASALKSMGAKIEGAGTEMLTITGVRDLKPLNFKVMPDRIEAGTFMVASAMTKGNVLIKDCPIETLDVVCEKLRAAGAVIEIEEEGVRVKGDWPITSVDIKTNPYPGFPTDMQAQMTAMMSIGSGLSVISETIFENRFMHIGELKRMGADISVDGRNAIVRGVRGLSGAPLMATDLRASASLILAGLVADGVTEISRVYHLDRGYAAIEKKLSALGADIKRISQ
ncbi:MAG: UDP-N-acetylglucosamine 1-carboxyvinyltransferase [Deltaproteobacteria bacterium]|nr:UDP-N-acetylglucosamine 1-carboxyvinyltransferase [Deltaproteobacteria bacterium]